MEYRCLFFVLPTLFIWLSCAQTSLAQVLVLELSANNVTAGEQLNASCTATVSAQSRVLYIDGQEVTDRIMPGSRVTSVAVGVTTTWTINPVQRGDGGEYYCFAGGDQGSDTDSPPQNVTVYFGPVFSHNGQEQMNGTFINITAVEASNITINCNVTASNPEVISLTLTNPSASNVNFDNGTGTITIESVTMDSEGTYTCSADNGVTAPTNINFVLMLLTVPSSSVQMTTTPATAVLEASTALIPQTPSAQIPRASPTQMPQASSTLLPQASPTPDSARNVLAGMAVIAVTLLNALLLS